MCSLLVFSLYLKNKFGTRQEIYPPPHVQRGAEKAVRSSASKQERGKMRGACKVYEKDGIYFVSSTILVRIQTVPRRHFEAELRSCVFRPK